MVTIQCLVAGDKLPEVLLLQKNLSVEICITNGKSLRTARKLLEKDQFGYGYQNEPAVLGSSVAFSDVQPLK